jgi:ACS family hexuronate transporter-like MFS transporter
VTVAAPPRTSRVRWYIAGLLCLSSTLNYLDRQTLSVLASTIQRELHLTDVQYSYVTSSFLASYTVMYAVSGRVIDAVGVRRGLMLFVSAWSVANMLHAFARSLGGLAFFRVLLGASEPGNFPAGVRAASEWFPLRERALAVGIFNSGTAIGGALAAPIVSAIALAWGWRSAFVVTGALGFVWVAVWARSYEHPERHPGVADAERALIAAGRPPASTVSAPVGIPRLLAMPETWGCMMPRILLDPVTYFLIFWIPKYLQEVRGFSLADLGKYAWIPFAALAVGNIVGGATPRSLVGRGWSVDRARKTTMLSVSCGIAVCFLLIAKAGSPAVALLLISAVMFGHGAWGNITLPAEVFPSHLVGTVTGLGGALGGAVGVVTQLEIGRVVQTISYTPLFVVCAFVYLLTFVLVCWLVGELGTVRTVAATR